VSGLTLLERVGANEKSFIVGIIIARYTASWMLAICNTDGTRTSSTLLPTSRSRAAEEAARKNALGMAGQTIERRLRGEEEAEASEERERREGGGGEEEGGASVK